MRKKERETTLERAYEILDQSPYVTLSMLDENEKPYAIMLSPARIEDTLYVHCAVAGKKLDCIQKHPEVCVSAVSTMQNAPQFYTVEYASCVIQGIASIVEDKTEKRKALYEICARYSADYLNKIDEKIERSLANVGIVKIHITSITGKESPKLRK